MITFAPVIDTIFPLKCHQCRIVISNHSGLCQECWPQLDFITPPFCVHCGLPMEYKAHYNDINLCHNCITSPPKYTYARSALRYEGICRSLVTRFKYYDNTIAANLFAQWMTLAAQDIISYIDYIIPVPLHWTRFIKRRYNQSLILAHYIGKSSNLPVYDRLLIRQRATTPQAQLPRESRLKNVRGAFHVKPQLCHLVSDRHILLVDDVMTSGETLSSCTKTLLQHKAKHVSVLTLARTPL